MYTRGVRVEMRMTARVCAGTEVKTTLGRVGGERVRVIETRL